MKYVLRRENELDHRDTENLTREAFWDVYRPGCVEHLLVHKLRNVAAFVAELNYVVADNAKIIGNIMYSKAKVISKDNVAFEVLCLGPVSVLPEYQHQGIGSSLIEETIKMAGKLGYKGVFLMGSPDFYPRFGFRNAKAFNVTTSSGENFDYFMGLELEENSLNGIEGKFYEDSVFQIAPHELEEFEKQFPAKEKHITDTQLK